MKKLLLFVLVALWGPLANAQVVVAPTILFMSDHSPFGTFLVINKSTVPQEISVSFRFGYPESDSLGNVRMQYDDSLAAEKHSCEGWIRGFPEKFILNPEQQQVVRLLISAPPGMADGEYWTRLITSSTPQAKMIDTVKGGITANITFVLQQVTTVIYEKGNVNTSVSIPEVSAYPDSASFTLVAHISRGGNSPFLGTISAVVKNRVDSVVYSDQQVIAIYRSDMYTRFNIPLAKLQSGRYTAELKLKSRRADVPDQDLLKVAPIKKAITFSVQ